MKFALPLVAALSVFSIASAAPTPAPGINDLLGPFAGVLGGLGGLSGQVDPKAASSAPPTNPATESVPDMAPSLQKRGVDIKVLIDAIVKVNTEAMVKILTKLKVDICADIHSKIHLAADGILTTDTDVKIPKISAKIKSEVDAAVHTKIDADAKVMVMDKIKVHAKAALLEHCPLGDDACILKLAAKIVASIEAAVKLDVHHLFVALRANLMTYVRAKVEVVIHDLGLNLLVEKIHVKGFVDATAQVQAKLELCVHAIVDALDVTVVADAVAVIKSFINI